MYFDGSLTIRERPRDLNHSIEVMNKPPFDQMKLNGVEQIFHGCISKGYYAVSFIGAESNIEMFFQVEKEALEMIDAVKKVDGNVNKRARKQLFVQKQAYKYSID